MKDNSRVVFCNYGERVFNKHAPISSRGQVTYQAFIIKLTIGVCVTTKVEEKQGSIVKIVVFHFKPIGIELYPSNILTYQILY